MAEPKRNNNQNTFFKIIRFVILMSLFFGSGYWLGKKNYSLDDIVSKIKNKEQSKDDKSGSLKDKEENEEKLTFYKRLTSKKEILLPSASVRKSNKKEEENSLQKKYALQIASFQKEEFARNYINKMADTSFSPYISPVNLNKYGVWYRVLLGEFTDEKEALEYGNRILKPKGIYYLIIETGNSINKKK